MEASVQNWMHPCSIPEISERSSLPSFYGELQPLGCAGVKGVAVDELDQGLISRCQRTNY